MFRFFLDSLSIVSFDDSNECNQIINTLQVVLKQAGFLIDKTAIKLIEKYAEEEKNIVCLVRSFHFHIGNVMLIKFCSYRIMCSMH